MVRAKFIISHWLSRILLQNPIILKELQVTARRKRSYWMRMGYAIFLPIVLLTVWMIYYNPNESWKNPIIKLAELGKMFTVFIVWSQLIACQILAIICLSSSISDEIYHRTLGALMSTPLHSLQIVYGKLVSRLLQLLVILGINLPVLAAIRMFGGIAWSFLWQALIITLYSMILAGSLSLLISVYCQRAHTVIIITVLSLVTWWIVVPGLAAIPGAIYGLFSEVPWLKVFSFFNPYFNLGIKTTQLDAPAWARWYDMKRWICDGILSLGASFVMLSWASIRVRQVGLAMMGGHSLKTKHKETKSKKTSQRPNHHSRPLTSCPIRWKERRVPLLGKHPKIIIAFILFVLILLTILYIAASHERSLTSYEFHISVTLSLMGLASLFTMVISATCITTEREARSWDVLLATPIDPHRIAYGKWLGIIRRTLPAWSFAIGHVLLFTCTGHLRPYCGVLILLIILGLIVFLSCLGLCCSALCKRTNTAIVWSIVIPLTVWFAVPILVMVVSQPFLRRISLEDVFTLNPYLQVTYVIHYSRTGWNFVPRVFGIDLTAIIMTYSIGQMITAVGLAKFGISKFRRHLS